MRTLVCFLHDCFQLPTAITTYYHDIYVGAVCVLCHYACYVRLLIVDNRAIEAYMRACMYYGKSNECREKIVLDKSMSL